MIFDSIVHYSPEGELLDVWSSYDQLEELQEHHQPLELDSPKQESSEKAQRATYEYYHLNTVEILPETPLGELDSRFRAGNIMLIDPPGYLDFLQL